jgi:membrane associated rhomboid family serine protease
MDMTTTLSIVAISIMIVALIVAYVKKIMMTYALIFANVLVFIITFIFPSVVYNLGFSPSYLSIEGIPKLYTLFTSMFIHGGILHIFGNMLVFFFMGIAFEDRIGWKKFLIIYLLAGVCGTLTHSLLNIGSEIILVGASGAIFGILGAFAFSYPTDEVVMPIPLIFIMIFRRIKVMYAALIFGLMETAFAYFGTQDGTAHFAHIGGIIGGAVLAVILIRRNKTHTKEGKTIYYDSFSPKQKKNIDYVTLNKFATTPKLKDMLQKIQNETIPHAQDLWLEHFIEKAKCPKCGKSLNHMGREIFCKNCDYKTKY